MPGYVEWLRSHVGHRKVILPYATGNTHPLFMGWVQGAGTPVGMLAEMLAAGLNANCGGRDHVGLEVERQIARWSAELLGLPPTASGLFVTGTSMANFLAVRVALTAAFGADVRRKGVRGIGMQPVAYASEQAHACIVQALELSGIGAENLRLIPVDKAGAIRADLLHGEPVVQPDLVKSPNHRVQIPQHG